MKMLLIFAFIIFFKQLALSTSAYRQPGTDYQKYFQIHKKESLLRTLENKEVDPSASVMDSAHSIGDFQESLVTASKISVSMVNEMFNYLRDKRDFLDESNFKRRITWFYPDDGCYARSAIMQSLLREKVGENWNQIFLFGNLELKTKFSSLGSVTWWYHVAPIVRTDEGVFVFDPSVNLNQVLTLKDWLSQVNAGTDAKVAICGSNAYVPESSCIEEGSSHSGQALDDEKEIYFKNEWDRIKSLNLNPEEILGENPPWK